MKDNNQSWLPVVVVVGAVSICAVINLVICWQLQSIAGLGKLSSRKTILLREIEHTAGLTDRILHDFAAKRNRESIEILCRQMQQELDAIGDDGSDANKELQSQGIVVISEISSFAGQSTRDFARYSGREVRPLSVFRETLQKRIGRADQEVKTLARQAEQLNLFAKVALPAELIVVVAALLVSRRRYQPQPGQSAVVAPDCEFVPLGHYLQNVGASISDDDHRRQRAVVDYSADVICLLDTELVFLSVNPAAKSMWGYEPSELYGRSLRDFMSVEDMERSVADLVGSDRSIQKVEFECRFRRKNNTFVHLLWSCHWSATEKGLFCVAHDITERKVAEQALRDSEERIRTLLAELPAALILVDKSGTIEMANETTTRMTGYTSDDLVDNFIGILFPDELADPERLPKLIEDCSKASFDTSTTKNTGERVPVQVSVNEFKLAGKEKYLFILVDFTERYAIEQLRREFVAMIGHELRTPLSSIEGILVLASDGVFGALNEQGARMMGKGQNETRRLLGLVNDLLELEKMRSGTFPINREQMSLDEVIASSIQVVMPIADKNKLSINYLPQPLSLNADPARILQVLVNLLSNAIKFSPKGGTINVTVETLSSGVKICVRDYGRGIPPEKISQLFQRYSQVQADDCRKLGGTGLGLAICKAIVDQHQGTIGVESVPGEGSTFWFCLES